jgi:hypothetical protein
MKGFKGISITLGLVLIFSLSLPACSSVLAVFQNPNYVYENGAVLVGGNGKPIELKSNPQAVDISYSALFDFVRQDATDSIPYVAQESAQGAAAFVCSDFAEMVHNNAETAGIRAGYVGIDFADGSIGHAITAFQTIDKGLVFIDCTGPSIYSQLEVGSGVSAAESWDKVGYLEVGRKYGVIGLDWADSPDYAFYLQFAAKWQQLKDQLASYNADVSLYNQEITGKVYRPGSPELTRLRAWESQLAEQSKAIDVLRQQVGDSFFKPLGVVKSFFVHW